MSVKEKYLGTVRFACVSIFLSLFMGLRLHRSHIFKVNMTRYKLGTSSAPCQFQFLANGAWRALYFQDLKDITSFWNISTSDSSLAPCHIWLLHRVQGYNANLYCPLQESLRFPAPPCALESIRNPTSLYNSMPIMAEICRYYICGRYSVVQLCSGFLHHNVKK